MLWVHICPFKCSEHKLTGGCIIGVWPQKHVRKLKFGGHVQEVLGLVVLGPVHDNHSVLPPGRTLLVKPECQGSKVKFHHLGIGIRLGQGHIDVSERIKSEYHRHTRRHLHLRN